MKPLVAVMLVGLFLCAPAEAKWHKAHLTAHASPMAWKSPQTFKATDRVEFRLYVRRREINAEGLSRCAAGFYGRGITGTVATCGTRLRLVVAATSRSVRVVVKYRLL